MLKFLPHFAKEIFSARKIERTPEPMLMLDESQVNEYHEYASKSSTMMASYLFHATAASQTFGNCKKVLDLGCGPATQLSIVAELNPHIEFVGVDLSENMLKKAQQLIHDKKLKNITLIEDDISTLESIQSGSFDGIMSTVALHHLPTLSHLENTFRQIQRVMVPGGALYITDFSLLKSEETIEFIVNLNQNQPPIFKEDYLASLRASFQKSDIIALKENYFSHAKFISTFIIPVMFILKTEEQTSKMNEKQAAQIFKSLNDIDKRILKDLYQFFKLNGFKNHFVRQLFKKDLEL